MASSGTSYWYVSCQWRVVSQLLSYIPIHIPLISWTYSHCYPIQSHENPYFPSCKPPCFMDFPMFPYDFPMKTFFDGDFPSHLHPKGVLGVALPMMATSAVDLTGVAPEATKTWRETGTKEMVNRVCLDIYIYIYIYRYGSMYIYIYIYGYI